jgi:hypothetical protein
MPKRPVRKLKRPAIAQDSTRVVQRRAPSDMELKVEDTYTMADAARGKMPPSIVMGRQYLARVKRRHVSPSYLSRLLNEKKKK